MDRKVLAILLILIIGACLTMGCAGRKSDGGATPTIVPTPVNSPAASTAPTVQAPVAPGLPTPTPSPLTGNAGTGGPVLDPSLADISGEGQNEGGFPETGLPTPTLD